MKKFIKMKKLTLILVALITFSMSAQKKKNGVGKSQKKVAFNIASEASYVYILSGQMFIKNAQNGRFWRVFENLMLAVKQCYTNN